MEYSLLQSEPLDDKYSKLIGVMGTSISKHLLDEHFTVVWASDFYYELIGYPKEEYEVLFHNQCDLYFKGNELSWEAIVRKVAKALENKEDNYTIFVQMPRKGGTLFWAKLVATFTDQYIDGYQVAYTTITDVTEMMQMKSEMSITYDNIPGFVTKYRIKDGKFTLLEANRRFKDFFGINQNNFTDFSAFLQEEFSKDEFLKQKLFLMSEGKPVNFVVRIKGIQDKYGWFQINGNCVGQDEGNPIYMIFYIDITDIKEMQEVQEQLKKALDMAESANRAKSDFFSRMSHDIRTPMNAIVGMTDIAIAHLQDTEKVHSCLQRITSASQHLLGLINDVLDMSKIESGKMQLNNDSMSLPEVMESIVAIIQPNIKKKEQDFLIRLREVKHEQFFCDALRLRQVFINILSNANKFTPNGGKITFEIREIPSEVQDIAMMQFTIADNGIGMKAEFTEHIFDTFSRERDSRVDQTEGSGLGMAITKKIVDMMGGAIEVESCPEQGSTFRIMLPLHTDNASILKEPFPGLHILVVDDDDIMCEYTVHLLEEIGVYSEWVNSGKAALAKLKEAIDEGEVYDAVILDWKMPDLNGVETARLIRKLAGDKLPILITSAYDWNDIEEQAMSAGVNGFLSKPLFASTLCRGLQKYVLQDTGKLYMEKKQRFDFNGRRILLFEDNELNQEITMEMLENSGAMVTIAGNGAEGLNIFENSSVGYFDLILMDIQMPIMNGYVATQKIRALSRSDATKIPILAMTADAFSEDIIHAREVGMNGHLTKPIGADQLINVLKKYFV